MPLDTANERLCDDCGVPLIGRYCHACGEDSQPPRRELKALLKDGLDNVFSFTEHVPATARDLVLDPGRILRGLRDGDRKRYLTPFKLYVSASVVFFLFLAISGVSLMQFEVRRTGGPISVTQLADGTAEMKGFYIQARTLMPEGRTKPDPQVAATLKKAAAELPDEGNRSFIAAVLLAVEKPQLINDDIATWAPRALWLLMPLYALMIWPLYRRGTLAVDHFIFSLWGHTTLYLLMILGGLWNLALPKIGLGLVLLAYQAYLTVGLKTYYGRSWVGAVVKGGLISAAYTVVWLALSFVFFLWQALKFLPPDYFFTE
ncbi:MAG: hypothetical protein K0R83_2179 [Caulobacter sp.]|nr:hypothetical protein [Caulobacter sp.]